MPPGVEDRTETSTLPRLPVATKLRISSRRSSTKSPELSVIWVLRAGPVGSNWSHGAAESVAGQQRINSAALHAAPADRHPRRILFPSPRPSRRCFAPPQDEDKTLVVLRKHLILRSLRSGRLEGRS